MVEPKCVVTVKDNVVEYDEVSDKVCEILGVNNLHQDGLGWDFWCDFWIQHAEEYYASCSVSQCTVYINYLLKQFAKDERATQVLKAFKQVLGDKLSENGVHFEYY